MSEWRYGTKVRVIGGVFDGMTGKICGQSRLDGDYMVDLFNQPVALVKYFKPDQLTTDLDPRVVDAEGYTKDMVFELEYP